jgi:hypothetical protein
MFARKLSRLAGLVLAVAMVLGVGATGASAAEASHEVQAATLTKLTHDWT